MRASAALRASGPDGPGARRRMPARSADRTERTQRAMACTAHSLAFTLALVAVLHRRRGCAPSASRLRAPSSASRRSAEPTAGSTTPPRSGSLVIVGRIVTMDEPADRGGPAHRGRASWPRRAPGTRCSRSPRDDVPVMDIGENVAYPGSSTPTPTGSATASTTAWNHRPKPWTWPSPGAGPRSPSSGSTLSGSTS